MHWVDRNAIDDVKAVLLVTFGVVVGVVIAYIWPWKTTVVGNTKDWIDVATAIGTVGAVVTALAIASADRRRRKTEAEDRAALVAARVVPPLLRLVDEIRSFDAQMSFQNLETNEYISVQVLLNWTALMRAAPSPVSQDDLVAITPLPNRGAFRLARGLAQFGIALDSILAEWKKWGEVEYCLRDEEVQAASAMLQGPLELLTIGARECKRAAMLVSAPPSAEELYGD